MSRSNMGLVREEEDRFVARDDNGEVVFAKAGLDPDLAAKLRALPPAQPESGWFTRPRVPAEVPPGAIPPPMPPQRPPMASEPLGAGEWIGLQNQEPPPRMAPPPPPPDSEASDKARADRAEVARAIEEARRPVTPVSPEGAARRRARASGDETFNKAVEFTLKAEGPQRVQDINGYPVKLGINTEWHPDVNLDKLTEKDARRIYRREYWDAIGADKMPPPLAAAAFDTAVIMGPRIASDLVAKSGGDPQRLLLLRQMRHDLDNRPEAQRFKKIWRRRVSDLADFVTNLAIPVAGAEERPLEGPGAGDDAATPKSTRSRLVREARLLEDNPPALDVEMSQEDERAWDAHSGGWRSPDSPAADDIERPLRMEKTLMELGALRAAAEGRPISTGADIAKLAAEVPGAAPEAARVAPEGDPFQPPPGAEPAPPADQAPGEAPDAGGPPHTAIPEPEEPPSAAEQAVRDLARVKTEAAKREIEAQRKAQTEFDQKRAKIVTDLERHQQGGQKAFEMFLAVPQDPAHFWRNLSMPGKIAAYVALFLGGGSNGRNYAAEGMQRSIDQEARSQAAGRERASEAYKYFRQFADNDQQALDLLKAHLTDAAAGRAKRTIAEVAPAEIAAEAELKIQAMRQDAFKWRRGVAAQQVEQAMLLANQERADAVAAEQARHNRETEEIARDRAAGVGAGSDGQNRLLRGLPGGSPSIADLATAASRAPVPADVVEAAGGEPALRQYLWTTRQGLVEIPGEGYALTPNAKSEHNIRTARTILNELGPELDSYIKTAAKHNWGGSPGSSPSALLERGYNKIIQLLNQIGGFGKQLTEKEIKFLTGQMPDASTVWQFAEKTLTKLLAVQSGLGRLRLAVENDNLEMPARAIPAAPSEERTAKAVKALQDWARRQASPAAGAR